MYLWEYWKYRTLTKQNDEVCLWNPEFLFNLYGNAACTMTLKDSLIIYYNIKQFLYPVMVHSFIHLKVFKIYIHTQLTWDVYCSFISMPGIKYNSLLLEKVWIIYGIHSHETSLMAEKIWYWYLKIHWGNIKLYYLEKTIWILHYLKNQIIWYSRKDKPMG